MQNPHSLLGLVWNYELSSLAVRFPKYELEKRLRVVSHNADLTLGCISIISKKTRLLGPRRRMSNLVEQTRLSGDAAESYDSCCIC